MKANFLNLLEEIDIDKIDFSQKHIQIKNLLGSSKSFFIAKLVKEKFNKTIIITKENDIAENYYHDLINFFESNNISLIKEPKYTFKSKIKKTDNILEWIIDGILKVLEKNYSIIIIPQAILNYKLPHKNNILNSKETITQNQNLNYEEFTKNLMLNGFERKEYVSYQGEISIRGGIVDIFPIGWDNPIRIEFWGDTIESIREFDTLSQRSIKEYKQITFYSSIIEFQQESTIFDYLDKDYLIIKDEIDLESIEEEVINHFTNYKSLELNNLTYNKTLYNTKSQPIINSSINNLIQILANYYYDGYKLALAADSKIHIDRLKELFISALNSDSLEIVNLNLDTKNFLNNIIWLENSFSEGFIWVDFKLLLFNEHQIFNRNRIKDYQKNKHSKALTLRELSELKIGDYVVHEDKGIGLFDGFKTVEISGHKQDCVKLRYADGDVLYVNINYINKISKYSAQEGASPVLSKLGTTDWTRKKSRAKSRLKDIARDLIKLYAKRKAIKGFAYPPDNLWQKEFEAAFIYEDTPDQKKTTEEIKTDMESNYPMDRLVCGDVGFGKTEVAIRAAFKAVQSGKQVAVLVPTTILAKQHYMSFKDRFAKFPVNIEVLSRFKTKSQQTKIVNDLSQGKIDIIIATHRILSKDIKFKDLGLLIIDEEHRFGVSAKEKLRIMKENIDTLTLTATPIPRTLNFSLMGARDLSIMETPPRNRLPIITNIIEWDDEILIEAIEFEINRDGQVFFVSDKVEDLDKIAFKLQELFPKYKIGIAHGKMQPNELEKVMENFIENKYQILLATKIIESGIDIPNANTIIINRAHNFGLAELYQLRGRVGRTNVQAYCYLIIPETYKLNSKALRRLQAIEEFTELGSGFQLSMRDLEIRGAGNLLGAEQSGFIIDIGFDLFQKIIDEAINELKYDEFSDIFEKPEIPEKEKIKNEDIIIEIDKDALFPTNYITNDTERFNYYKKLYLLRSFEELNELIKEINDRFGKFPPEAENLIYVVKLRIAAVNTGFIRINVKNNILACEFPPSDNQFYYDKVFPIILDYISTMSNTKLVQTKTKLILEYYMNNNNDAIEFLWKINKTLDLL